MRKHYIDNTRWIVQIFVVLYHVFYMYNGIGISATAGQITKTQFIPGDVFQYMVYPWIMVVLFIVSGISARLALDKSTHKEFIRSRTTKLLVPSTIGVLVFGWVQGYLNMSLSDGAIESISQAPVILRILIMCVSGTGVLWYLQVLWICSILLIPVRNIEKDRLWKVCGNTPLIVIILLALPLWGAAQILNTPVIVVYRFGLYTMAFFMGYFVFSHDEVIEKIKKYYWLFAAAALILGAVFTYTYFGQSYPTAPVNRTVLFCFYSYYMSVAVIAVCARYMDFTNKFTAWMSKKAWGIYIFHYIGISAFGLYIARSGILPAWLIYILTAAAGFAAGIILEAAISRIPFLRWAVLGIKKKKEN